MSAPNDDLNSALKKLGITFNHPRFQSLPANNGDPLWERFEKKFNLDEFELGALKNARCVISSVGKLIIDSILCFLSSLLDSSSGSGFWSRYFPSITFVVVMVVVFVIVVDDDDDDYDELIFRNGVSNQPF